MRTFRLLPLLGLLMLPVLLRAQGEKFSPDDLDFIAKHWPQAKESNTGIRYIIEEPGSGPTPRAGDLVYVNYSGRLLDGTVFDRRENPERPFSFRIDRFAVIAGWDQTLKLMRPGEKRLVIIPPELAYGTVGKIPTIPRNSTLVFEIVLRRVDREE